MQQFGLRFEAKQEDHHGKKHARIEQLQPDECQFAVGPGGRHGEVTRFLSLSGRSTHVHTC